MSKKYSPVDHQNIVDTNVLHDPMVVVKEQASKPATPASGSGGFYFKTDGLPYAQGDDGLERPLIRAVSAKHENPGFDGTWAVNAGHGFEPPGWSVFWQAASVTDAYDTVDTISGGGSAKITQPNTGAIVNVRINSLTAFGVLPGDTVTVSVWAKTNLPGLCTLFVQLITGTTPAQADVLGGGIVHSQSFTITSTWALYSASFTVPAGHIYGRVSFPMDGIGAGSWWLDESGSVVVTPAAPVNQWAKEPVRCMTTATFNPTSTAPSVVDGVTLVVGDRVLKATLPDGLANDGIWQVTTVGTGANGVWARPADANTSTKTAGAEVAVLSGPTYGGTRWANSFKSTDTLDSTLQRWTQMRGDRPEWRSLGLNPGQLFSASPILIGFGVNNGGSGLTASGGRMTVSQAGVYFVSTQITCIQSSLAPMYHIIELNQWRSAAKIQTRPVVAHTNGAGTWDIASVDAHFDALPGDIFDVYVSPQVLNASSADATRCHFNAHRLGGVG